MSTNNSLHLKNKAPLRFALFSDEARRYVYEGVNV
jgi:hypothetical protein